MQCPAKTPIFPDATIRHMAEETKPVSTEKPAEKKPANCEDFIVNWPLYTGCEFKEGFEAPRRISYDCDNTSSCGKETTWAMMGNPYYQDIAKGLAAFYTVQYVCSRCGTRFLSIMYRMVDSEVRQSGLGTIRGLVVKVQKIGQFPPDVSPSSKGVGEQSREIAREPLQEGSRKPKRGIWAWRRQLHPPCG
jgi:hypothetical protein